MSLVGMGEGVLMLLWHSPSNTAPSLMLHLGGYFDSIGVDVVSKQRSLTRSLHVQT